MPLSFIDILYDIVMLINVNLPELNIPGYFDRAVCDAFVNLAKQCVIISQIEDDIT